MKLVPIVVCVLLILIGAYASRNYQLNSLQKTDKEVLSDRDIDKPPMTPSLEISPQPTLTLKITITPTPQTSSSQIISDQFRYPGSALVSSNSTGLSLKSSDDTDKITDWYKAKIESIGVNVKSFVTTKANDKVLNKLVGSDGKTEIRVEIRKNPDESTVEILVTVSVK